MFVFLVLSILYYPNETLSDGIYKGHKTCRATKRYWRPLNSKKSLNGLQYFLSFKIFWGESIIQSKSNHLTLVAHAWCRVIIARKGNRIFGKISSIIYRTRYPRQFKNIFIALQQSKQWRAKCYSMQVLHCLDIAGS